MLDYPKYKSYFKKISRDILFSMLYIVSIEVQHVF